ncbi:hypothetical protein Pcinc_040275 [Petrolisthes cinctipes]|uniref:Uncharacterized protein n=1 Tax=Petrolisthes cinctipes TaxID=88211 RepID=A0AAE1BN23_PETCI|nr:hypothetical protein Pcinc_040275 [Petrolisthes cinctipes]
MVMCVWLHLRQKQLIIFGLLSVTIVVAIAVGLGVGLKKNGNSNPEPVKEKITTDSVPGLFESWNNNKRQQRQICIYDRTPTRPRLSSVNTIMPPSVPMVNPALRLQRKFCVKMEARRTQPSRAYSASGWSIHSPWV